MRGVFDSTEINGMKLANRLVRSATWEGMCPDEGKPTDKLVDLYRNLAKGGVGLIITGYTFVWPDGRQLGGTMGMHTDELIAEMKRVTGAVHDEGSAICVQLVHAGGQSSEKIIGRNPIGPSAVAAAQYGGVTPDAMTSDDINEVVAAFGQAARRVKESGFDAVQLHGAHGYLINQFLSPLTNQRTDDYGGTIENRARFMMEVYGAVRAAVGDNFPVMIKLSGCDNLEGGLSSDDAREAAVMLDKAGIDAIEVSGGTAASGDEGPLRGKINKPEREGYNLSLAKGIKDAVSCAVMSVGGFRSIEVAEDAIKNGMDYVCISRPFIREPGLAARWKSGDRAKATCISCSKCFIPGLKEGGIYCVQEKKGDKAS